MQQQKPTYNYLTEDIRSGQYYKEAIEWYSDIYFSPIAERCLVTMIMIFSFVVTMVSISSYLHLQENLRPVVPFVYQNPDIMEYIPRIKHLRSPGESTKHGISKYLIIEYVKTHESYDPKLPYSANYNRIKANSAESVFQKYRSGVDLRNPKSPFVIYQKHTTRVIEVQDAKLFLENEPYKAIVNFLEILETQGRKPKKRMWTAEVEFKYKDVSVDQDTGKVSPMKFLVTGYKATQQQQAE